MGAGVSGQGLRCWPPASNADRCDGTIFSERDHHRERTHRGGPLGRTPCCSSSASRRPPNGPVGPEARRPCIGSWTDPQLPVISVTRNSWQSTVTADPGMLSRCVAVGRPGQGRSLQAGSSCRGLELSISAGVDPHAFLLRRLAPDHGRRVAKCCVCAGQGSRRIATWKALKKAGGNLTLKSWEKRKRGPHLHGEEEATLRLNRR